MELVPSWFDLGYNSHGRVTTFKDIYDTEVERENEPFISYSEKEVDALADIPAIWVTTSPYSAFLYCLYAEDYERDPEEVKKEYPEWQEEITTYDTSDVVVIKDSYDEDDGYIILLGPKERIMEKWKNKQ